VEAEEEIKTEVGAEVETHIEIEAEGQIDDIKQKEKKKKR
jgi:hypothetical protein